MPFKEFGLYGSTQGGSCARKLLIKIEIFPCPTRQKEEINACLGNRQPLFAILLLWYSHVFTLVLWLAAAESWLVSTKALFKKWRKREKKNVASLTYKAQLQSARKSLFTMLLLCNTTLHKAHTLQITCAIMFAYPYEAETHKCSPVMMLNVPRGALQHYAAGTQRG